MKVDVKVGIEMEMEIEIKIEIEIEMWKPQHQQSTRTQPYKPKPKPKPKRTLACTERPFDLFFFPPRISLNFKNRTKKNFVHYHKKDKARKEGKARKFNKVSSSRRRTLSTGVPKSRISKADDDDNRGKGMNERMNEKW